MTYLMDLKVMVNVYFDGGWVLATFWFFKSLDNTMVNSLGNLFTKGIVAEQKSYGF